MLKLYLLSVVKFCVVLVLILAAHIFGINSGILTFFHKIIKFYIWKIAQPNISPFILLTEIFSPSPLS